MNNTEFETGQTKVYCFRQFRVQQLFEKRNDLTRILLRLMGDCFHYCNSSLLFIFIILHLCFSYFLLAVCLNYNLLEWRSSFGALRYVLKQKILTLDDSAQCILFHPSQNDDHDATGSIRTKREPEEHVGKVFLKQNEAKVISNIFTRCYVHISPFIFTPRCC